MIRVTPSTALILAVLLLLAPASTVTAKTKNVNTPPAYCPLTTDSYKARPKSETFNAKVGKPVKLGIVLTPTEIPGGFFVSATADLINAPDGTLPPGHAVILPGYPAIKATFDAPGTYTLNIRIGMIAKSSCGGAKAGLLYDGPVRVEVSQ